MSLDVRTALWAENSLAQAVAETFSGRARAPRVAIINGEYGAAWAPGGKPRLVFRFTFEGEAITAIDIIAEPGVLATLTIETENV